MTSGRAAPVAGDSVRARWPFVGRQAELDSIVASLDDPSVNGVVIHGPLGAGKSRLAEEFLAIAAANGWWCVRAVASERTRQVPLGAVAHLLPSRILLDRDDPMTLFPKVAATVRERGKGRRVVLLIDDPNLLDATTSTLVGQLLDAELNFLVGTVRTGEQVPAIVSALWRDERTERIDLDNLPRAALEAMLSDVLGPVAPDTVDALWTVSQGNVLFSRELVLGAIESGRLRHHRGVWRLDGPLVATARLADTVAARLEGLDEASRAALDRVALSEPIGLTMLESFSGDTAVEELERAGLVLIRADQRRQQVTLAQPLYGEILRAAIPTTARRRMLLERVRWIEDHGARRRDDVVTIASSFLDATGTADPELLMSAAWLARFNQDQVQVERLARAAISNGMTPESGLLLGEALHDLARYDEAGDVLLQALDLVDTEDDLFAPLVEMHVRNLMWGLQRPGDALSFLREMRATAMDDVTRAELAAEEGMVLSYTGRPREALDVLKAVEDSVHTRAWVIAAIAAEPALVATGQYELAIAVGDEAYEDHARLREHFAMAGPDVHRMFRVEALADLGHIDEASALAVSCYENTRRDAPANTPLWFVVALGRNAMLQGQLETARRWLAEGVARCEARDVGPRRVVLSLLATAAAWMGDVEAAADAVAELDSLEPFAYLRGEQALGPAWAAAATGELPRARALLLHSAGEAQMTGHWTTESWLLHDACRLGHRGAGERLRELADICEGNLVQARAAHAAAADAGHAAGLATAADEFEALGAVLFAAEAATQAADQYQRDGDQRAAATLRARAASLEMECESARTPLLVTADSVVPLTPREREICVLAAAGDTGPEIAAKLFLSVRTVNNHLQRAYTKLGVTNRGELAAALTSARLQRPGV